MFGYYSYTPPFSWPKTWQDNFNQGMELIELARKKCPPPRSWDGKKKLPWPIVIYFKGKRYLDIVQYNLDTGEFWYKLKGKELSLNQRIAGNFLVQRLH